MAYLYTPEKMPSVCVASYLLTPPPPPPPPNPFPPGPSSLTHLRYTQESRPFTLLPPRRMRCSPGSLCYKLVCTRPHHPLLAALTLHLYVGGGITRSFGSLWRKIPSYIHIINYLPSQTNYPGKDHHHRERKQKGSGVSYPPSLCFLA